MVRHALSARIERTFADLRGQCDDHAERDGAQQGRERRNGPRGSRCEADHAEDDCTGWGFTQLHTNEKDEGTVTETTGRRAAIRAGVRAEAVTIVG